MLDIGGVFGIKKEVNSTESGTIIEAWLSVVPQIPVSNKKPDEEDLSTESGAMLAPWLWALRD
jgi:hypothetical protein